MSPNINPITNTAKLVSTLPKPLQRTAKFIAMRESDGDLSTMRLGQELTTNLLPKAIFARGIVDLADNGFREIFENIIVYLGPKFVGEKIFRKLYSKGFDKRMKELVAKPAAELLKENNPQNKTLMPLKAAIAVSALAIPLAEYSISYVKNLFTLKLFKQADFNNIANLNKNKKEDSGKQKQVKDSAKKHIAGAGIAFASSLALSALLLKKGKTSKPLHAISEFILAPGSKIFKNNPKKAATLNKYFGLDFASKNGKLAMSNGQLTACVVAGGFGYFGAAKDRGKQDFKEVAYRFPLVGFYAITGSELLENGFKKMLQKKEAYKDLFSNNNEVPKLSELGDLAEKIAKKNGTSAESEFKRLFKQKSTVVMAPFLFGIGFMGLFVAGVSRFFTQYRYNKEMQENQKFVHKKYEMNDFAAQNK